MRPGLQITYNKKFKTIGETSPTDLKAVLEPYLPKSMNIHKVGGILLMRIQMLLKNPPYSMQLYQMPRMPTGIHPESSSIPSNPVITPTRYGREV
jgi:hypothetical protein